MYFGSKQIESLWLNLGFICLFFVASLGVMMRSMPFVEFPMPFPNILHAHSHTALLGWAFIMSTAGIINSQGLKFKNFSFEFGLISFAIIGMFLSFLYQSYGAISISFSTLFVLSAYVFLFRVFRLLTGFDTFGLLAKNGIIWFFVSTLGIWCLGPIVALLGKDHSYYKLAIEFFLHFQINGWLTYVALGLLVSEFKDIHLSKMFVYGLNTSLVLTFALNLLWVNSSSLFYVMNVLGVAIQLVLFGSIFLQLVKHKNFKHKTFVYKILFYVISLSLFLKATIPIVSLNKDWAIPLQTNRFLIIAFLHLILIGFVSFTFVLSSIRGKYLPDSKLSLIGVFLWIIGFIITEVLMALQGFNYSNFYSLKGILVFSILMFIGIGLIVFKRLKESIT